MALPSFCEISYDDLEFRTKCDGGTGGSVYRAVWISQQHEVAVKKLLALDTEIHIFSQLSHCNIVKFYGAVTKAPNYCLVTEYAENGSLFNILHNTQQWKIDFQQVLCWSRQIALGMNYLHSEAPVKVIHRDLKSKNVVINKDFVCKICDFGASRFMSGTTKMTLAGTFAWMSPEVIQCQPISDSADVWSYGVVLWEILTQELPYRGFEGIQIMWLIAENLERLTIPDSCPEMFAELLRACWRRVPSERPSFQVILKRLDEMSDDDGSLREETNSFFGRRTEWMQQIDTWLERLKKTARDLGVKEEDLRRREILLVEREKKLEQEFKVVPLESYDVNTWKEAEVRQWIFQLKAKDHQNSDLSQYADLFRHNAITGRRLLMLTQDNLRQMGIQSEGHIVELHRQISSLKHHNYRLQNFPPLNVTVPAALSHDSYVQTITLIVGCHFCNAQTLRDSKWKMYLDVDADDLKSAQHLIKDVTFVIADDTVKIGHYPYVMDRWKVGIPVDLTVECIVYYEDQVRRPRNSKLVHHVDPSNTHQVTQLCVSLTVSRNSSQHHSTRLTPNHVDAHMIHSQSSPMLHGAWSMRKLEHAMPPLDSHHHQESIWSDVVSGAKAAQLPVYNPVFTPIPPIPSTSNNGSPMHGKSSPGLSREVSSSASESGHSSVVGDIEKFRDIHYRRLSSPLTPRSGTEPDLSRLQSQESTDSGGVFTTPAPKYLTQTPFQNGRFADDATDRRNSGSPDFFGRSDSSNRLSSPDLRTVQSLADLSRHFMGEDNSKLKNGQQFGSGELQASVVNHRRSSGFGDSPVDDLPSSHVRSNSYRQPRGSRQLSRSSYSPGSADSANTLINGDQSETLTAGRDVESPLMTKSNHKGKNKKVKSGPQLRQTSMTSNRSMEVHGGNAKWRWK